MLPTWFLKGNRHPAGLVQCHSSQDRPHHQDFRHSFSRKLSKMGTCLGNKMGIKWWLWLGIFMLSWISVSVPPFSLLGEWRSPPLVAPFSDAFLLQALCSRTIPLRMISGGATVATQRMGNNGARTGFSMGRCRVGIFTWQFSILSRSHQAPTPMVSTALLQEVLPSCHSPISWEIAQVPLHPCNCLWFKTIVVKLPTGCTKKEIEFERNPFVGAMSWAIIGECFMDTADVGYMALGWEWCFFKRGEPSTSIFL